MIRKHGVSLDNTTFFSIIIDETTDVSTKKCLAILLRYYLSETKKVFDSFLDLVELDTGFSLQIEHFANQIEHFNVKSKIVIDSHLIPTWGITILHWIFDVSIISGKHC